MIVRGSGAAASTGQRTFTAAPARTTTRPCTASAAMATPMSPASRTPASPMSGSPRIASATTWRSPLRARCACSSSSNRSVCAASRFSEPATARSSPGPDGTARADRSVVSRSRVRRMSSSGANSCRWCSTASSTATTRKATASPANSSSASARSPVVGVRDGLLLGSDRRLDRRVRGADLVEHLLAAGGPAVVAIRLAGIDDRDGVGVQPVGRGLALGGQGPEHGAVGRAALDRVERDERALPAGVVRVEEHLLAGELEAAYPGLGVRHVLQHGLVGVVGAPDAFDVGALPGLQPVADQDLDQHHGQEQHKQHGEPGAGAVLHRDHPRAPAGCWRGSSGAVTCSTSAADRTC